MMLKFLFNSFMKLSVKNVSVDIGKNFQKLIFSFSKTFTNIFDLVWLQISKFFITKIDQSESGKRTWTFWVSFCFKTVKIVCSQIEIKQITENEAGDSYRTNHNFSISLFFNITRIIGYKSYCD